MFIKIFIPNENGKIELTVKQLENLLQEAAEKAVREKCRDCNRGYWYNTVTTTPSITLLSDKANSPSKNGEITWNWDKITCGDCSLSEPTTSGRNLTITNTIGDLGTLRSSINGQIDLGEELEKISNNKKGEL